MAVAVNANRNRSNLEPANGDANGDALCKLVEADMALHSAIYKVCGNSAIAETLEPICPHTQRAMVLVLEVNASRTPAWNQHKSIVRNILSGKPMEASELAFAHAANAGAYVE